MRARVVLLERDPEMVSLMRDILKECCEVVVPASPASIGDIDRANPDVVVIGTAAASPGELSTEQIVILARRHMGQRVPIVVLSAEPNVLAGAGSLMHLGGVTVISMPFDAETVWRVLDSIVGEFPEASASRLPAVCRHGFEDGGCPRCICPPPDWRACAWGYPPSDHERYVGDRTHRQRSNAHTRNADLSCIHRQ